MIMPENKLESSHNKKASKPFMSHIDRNTMTMTENCVDLTGHTIPYTKKLYNRAHCLIDMMEQFLPHHEWPQNRARFPRSLWCQNSPMTWCCKPQFPLWIEHPEIASNASNESWSNTKQNTQNNSLCMQATRYEHHACDVITDTMSSHRAWFPWSPWCQNFLDHLDTLKLPFKIDQMNHG